MHRRLFHLGPFFVSCLLLLMHSVSLCAQEGDPEGDEWQIPTRRGAQVLIVPPNKWLDKPEAEADQQARKDRCEALIASAKEDLKNGAGAKAYQKLFAALRENPDEAALRKVLGYYLSPRQVWQTSSVVPTPKAGTDVHPKFGWKARAYWRLDTPHFRITTSHSAAAAVDLGQQLETLHLLWRQLFFDYWSTPETLAARLEGGKDPLENKIKKMEVILFRDREEYIAKLSASESKIGLSTGLYVGKRQMSFFYAGDDSVKSTWDHEVAHQLFQEYDSLSDQPGEDQNFWVIEGAAMYLESLAKHEYPGGDYWSVGGFESKRLQIARYRALAGDFYMPLEKLVSLSRKELQGEPDIRKIYSQSAGLLHFFMDGQEGKYRPALIKYLRTIYEKKDRVDTLTKLTGKSYAELDEEYKAYLADVTDDDIANMPSPGRLAELSLGNTSVTHRSLSYLANCDSLTWLDFTGCKLSEKIFVPFANGAEFPKLERLFLERTGLTDASLVPIGKKMTTLKELDLSRLKVTDEGLKSLEDLSKLKTLYLTGTDVTDAGLADLQPLSSLETLEVSGTKVTKGGVSQLQSKMPQLKAATGGK